MPNVLFIDSITHDDDDLCTVVACINDIVVARPQTYSDPAEYGSAMCRGTVYLSDEVIPDDDAERCRFFSERVYYWEVIDDSD